jgi:tRNA A37 methylthiotransferase MiaB
MRALGERLAVRYAAGRVGGVADVLIEAGHGTVTGTSEDNLRIDVEGPAASLGDIVRVRLLSCAGARLIGTPEPGRTAPVNRG